MISLNGHLIGLKYLKIFDSVTDFYRIEAAQAMVASINCRRVCGINLNR